MRNILSIFALAGLAAPLFSQAGPGPAASAQPAPCLRTRTSFDLLVHASYAVTAPLFGPEGERAWAGKLWNPQFLYPLPPADTDGAVFTINHGGHTATWVTTLFDMDARHFQYVYFLPGLMITVIDVRFKPVTADSTAVNVVYTRTALTPEANPHVTAMTEGDKSAGTEWQQALDDYLILSKPGSKP
jgi:hypothetical protein